MVAWRLWKLNVLETVAYPLCLREPAPTRGRAPQPGRFRLRSLTETTRFQLRSLTDTTVWLPGARLRARCHRNRPHGEYAISPADRCSCGIYAGRDLAEVVEQQTTERNLRSGAVVVGEVKLWGKIRVGPKGFRAQFGYPSSLFLLAADRGARNDRAPINLSAYGVPVSAIGYRDLIEAMSRPDPAGWLGAA